MRFGKQGKGTAFSFILNVLGMAVAIAAFYIILVQVNYGQGYNRHIKDSDRVYAVSFPSWYEEGKYSMWICRPPVEHVIANCAEIESGCCAYLYGNNTTVIVGDGENPSAADPAVATKISTLEGSKAADVFGFQLVSGSLDGMAGGKTLAVCESEAERLGLHPGSSIMVQGNGGSYYEASVVAVYRDFPVNSDLGSFKMFTDLGDTSLEDWSEWSYPYWVKAREGVSQSELESSIGKIMESLVREQASKDDGESEVDSADRFRPHLVPLSGTYYDQTVSECAYDTGSRSTTLTLLAIAVLIIVIAVINYINFCFALVPVRLHSVNTRKVLGASRTGLVMGNVKDSVLMILASLVIAVAFVMLFQASTFASMLSCSTAFGANMGVAVLTVGIAIVVSVVASLFPAFYITSFSPALALKGSFAGSKSGQAFRYGLVGLQFVISISLIICATFIGLQRKYMLDHDMGFDREELLCARVSYDAANASSVVESRLRANPDIKDVAWATGDIVSPSRMGWGRDHKGENISFQCYPVSWNFPEFLGLHITEGRSFTEADEKSENGVFIFNEAARAKFHLTLDDKISGHRGPTDIAGFCNNFNYRALRDGVDPFCLYVFGQHPWQYLTMLFVRTQKNVNISSVIASIKEAVVEADPRLSMDDLDVTLFDERLQSQYGEEANLTKLITLFAVLAIIISLMGVFGLVMFETEHRRKEIGIRRVNGATVGDILGIFNARFIRIVLVCFVISVPLSWWIVHRYLDSFAYKVPMYLWVFAMALFATFAITVTVVTLRSLRAATENPCLSLKKE